MPTLEYYDNHETAAFNGYTFKKDKKTGYYLSSKPINGKRKRLHVYVWEFYNGDIPAGYEVHHIDHDKDNNEIKNFELLSREEHRKRHILEMSEETKEKLRKNLFENAIPASKEWHKSEAGRAWHKQHYDQVKDALHKTCEHKCLYCGKSFIGGDRSTVKFCSNNCKSAYRRKSGVDDIERKCIICGEKFIANRYSTAKYCEKHKRKGSRGRRSS